MVLKNTKARFLKSAVLMLIVGALFLLLIESAERNGLVSGLTKSIGRLVVWCVLLGLLLYATRKSDVGRHAMWVGCLLVFAALTVLVLEVTEDIDQLIDVPIVGGHSTIRVYLEILANVTWACSGFYWVYLLVHYVERNNRELELRVQARTDELAAANQKLELAMVELKQAEQQMIRRERLNALGRMAGGIAHDLNNALSPLAGYCELLQDKNISDEEKEYCLQTMHVSAHHAANIVKQLQYFYRTSDSQSHVPVSLDAIIHETIAMTRPYWQNTPQKDGILINFCTEELTNCVVCGSSVEIKQLFTNLIINAVDAMPNGGQIRIRSRIEAEHILVELEDTGVGMPPEVLEHCFEPFFTANKVGGGLGLSVCHGIAKRHSASIQVESHLDVGTRFRVIFPACKADVGIEDSSVLAASGIACDREIRVLVVDDDDLVRQSSTCLLNCLGVNVEVADNGTHALEMLTENDFQLLVTDLGIEGMTGQDVIREAKRLLPGIATVMVTGWSSAEMVHRLAADCAPDHFLEKPVSVEQWNTVIDALKHGPSMNAT